MQRILFIAIAALLFSKPALAQYPDNIYPDTAYAPFYYSVASGDPLADRVIIWTKVYMPDTLVPVRMLKWAVANDTAFHDIVAAGTTIAARQHDYTVKVDAGGLQAGHQYYYRFYTQAGRHSQTGICRTLPDDSVKHFKLAIVSCSSVWSGYFNAYRRIAERADIDYVVHLGDYVYDYVDPEEQRRMPALHPNDELRTLADWRERHTYYLLDPDLRAARQNKTWIAEWDNHDSHIKGKEKSDAGITAYYEYLPVRMPDTAQPLRIYRDFHFGRLADLDMIDMYTWRGKEDFAPGKPSILGLKQDAWFKDKLLHSKATWQLIGNQEMMGSWMSKGLPKFLHVPGNGTYFDPGDWDGYVADRERLYDLLDSAHIRNFVAMTGDAHMSFIIDLTKDPQNKKTYHKRTGQGAVGVEVLGPSISRGNMSDRHVVPRGTIPLVQKISNSVNPHHVYVNFAKHGYVTLDVTPERCVAQFCYSDILHHTTKETRGKAFAVRSGVGHWERKKVKN
jgi:alkaline phosphatase D